MPHPALHQSEHGDALLRTVEAAASVGTRHQFFVWLRLHLHRFVPHDVLLCLPGRAAGAAASDALIFNSIPLPEPVVSSLAQSASPFWRDLSAAWVLEGRRPAEVLLAGLSDNDAVRGLRKAGFVSLTVHGVDASCGVQPSLLLAFAHTAPGDASWRRVGLQLCLPQIHFAVMRVLREGQHDGELGGAVHRHLLTQRELEVLKAVRSARGNLEIGEQLGISALTVKNHLRTIMRKLGARNRVQAVAEAMARQLIV